MGEISRYFTKTNIRKSNKMYHYIIDDMRQVIINVIYPRCGLQPL